MTKPSARVVLERMSAADGQGHDASPLDPHARVIDRRRPRTSLWAGGSIVRWGPALGRPPRRRTDRPGEEVVGAEQLTDCPAAHDGIAELVATRLCPLHGEEAHPSDWRVGARRRCTGNAPSSATRLGAWSPPVEEPRDQQGVGRSSGRRISARSRSRRREWGDDAGQAPSRAISGASIMSSYRRAGILGAGPGASSSSPVTMTATRGRRIRRSIPRRALSTPRS